MAAKIANEQAMLQGLAERVSFEGRRFARTTIQRLKTRFS